MAHIDKLHHYGGSRTRIGPREILAIGIVVAASLTLGVGSAWWSVRHGTGSGEYEVGPWRAKVTAISELDSSNYVRARASLEALLGLPRAELVTYLATTDSAGATLDPACVYTIDGREPAARWWTLTAYDGARYLIPNEAKRYYVSDRSLARATDGTWAIQVGPDGTGDNAIPTKGARGLVLALRLYNPMGDVVADPGAIKLPRITKGACE